MIHRIFLFGFSSYVFAQTRPILAPTTFDYTYNNIKYVYDFGTLQKTLTSQVDYTITGGGYTWTFNIAGGVSSNPCSSCTAYLSPVTIVTNCFMVQMTTYNEIYCIGAASTQVVTSLTNDPSATGNGIKLTYTGGASCSAAGTGANRKAYVILKCDPNGTESSVCVYTFTFNAKEGCFTSAVSLSGTSVSSASSSSVSSANLASSSRNQYGSNSTSSDADASVISYEAFQTLLIEVIFGVIILVALCICGFSIRRYRRLTKPVILNTFPQPGQTQYGPTSIPFGTQYPPQTQYGTNYLQPPGQFGTTYAQNTIPIQFGTNYSGLPSSNFTNYAQSNIAAGLPPSMGFNPSINLGNPPSSNFVSSSSNSGLISGTGQLSASQSGTLTGTKGNETMVMEDFSGMATIQQGPMVMALPGHMKVMSNAMDFRLGKKIGAGGGGEIYYVDLLNNFSDLAKRSNGRKMIAKVMKEAGEKMFLQEVSIMAMFNSHKNFAELTGFESDSMTLIMVFYEKGAFDGWIKKTKMRGLSNIFSVIHGTFSALAAMHGCGIVHNDIKPANILLETDSDDTLLAKLTDFGISQVVENTTLLVNAFEVKSIRGWSLRYAAPERLATNAKINAWDKVRVSKAADTYSMGITIWEALCGDIPLF